MEETLLSPSTKSRRLNVTQLGDGLGKLPPQAVEIEDAVLGALMLERDALSIVIDILHPESFYKEVNQNVYKAIVNLFNNSQPVDIKTVTNQLRKSGQLESVGGAYYIAELTTKVNSAANIETHARIIAEQFIKRELIRICSEIQKDAYEDGTDAFQLLDRTEQSLFDISESHIRKNYDKMSDLMVKAIENIEARCKQPDGLTGVASGFSALDRVTSGWQPTDLIIIASRPGMGKTAFVVSVLINAAIGFNTPVAIFSLEMSSVQLVNRMIAAEAELESEKIKTGNLQDYEWEQIIHKTSKLSEAPIFIDDTPALSILELKAKSRRLVAQHGVKLIIIDYLQLMSGESDKKKGGTNREQEIAGISRALKGIAKELNVPVIALSQLSRAVETRGGDKRPMLSDLRESGSIEQDADMVLFLYRPEYYELNVDEAGKSLLGLGEVIVAKHRNGRLATVQLRFISKYTKFTEWDGDYIGEENYSPSNLGSENSDTTITFPSKSNNKDNNPF